MKTFDTYAWLDVSSYWWLENQVYQNILYTKSMTFSGHRLFRFFSNCYLSRFFQRTHFIEWDIFCIRVSYTAIFILHLIEENKFEMWDITFYLFFWYRSLIFICQKIAGGKLKVKIRCNQKIFEKFLHIIYLFHVCPYLFLKRPQWIFLIKTNKFFSIF